MLKSTLNAEKPIRTATGLRESTMVRILRRARGKDGFPYLCIKNTILSGSLKKFNT